MTRLSAIRNAITGTRDAPGRVGARRCLGIYCDFLFGEVSRMGAGLVSTAMGPVASLKGALDYLLWHHLYEAASPGWWEHTNRRMQKESGRVMQGYLPSGKIPWTPWAIGA